MLKIILRLKAFDHQSLLSGRIMTFLLATLLITIGIQGVLRADTGQLLFEAKDIKDVGSLAVKLQDTRAVVSQYIAGHLSAETQQLLEKYDGISHPSPDLQKALIANLNRLLQAGSLYDALSFVDIELSEQSQLLLRQNPESGEELVRLNRFLLADAYPHELASLGEKHTSENSKEIEKCRENLRQINLARENYRADTHEDVEWLSGLSPKYVDKKVLLCPADATNGKPGVLTEDASDPRLPCSYLYEIRPSEKMGQQFLLEVEGDMLPVVRCEHHSLNLSVSGKIYRNGPQRVIYNNSTVKMTQSVPIHTELSGDLPPEVRKQMEKDLLKNGPKVTGTTVLKVFPSDNNLHAQLKEQLSEAFLESPEGQSLLKQLGSASPTSTVPAALAHLLDKPIPAVRLSDLSGKSVKLETFRGKFILLYIFSINSDPYGPKLRQLEKLLENYDVSELQVIGIGLSDADSAEAIEAFKDKYQLSMPIWIGKNDQIRAIFKRDASESDKELVTLILNPELVVKDVSVDLDIESISRKLEKLITSKK